MAADDDFLADTLGILQEVERDKFRFELGKVVSKQIGEAKLHGWGTNKQGQLGIYGLNNVQEPKLIPLPELSPDDHIVSVDCGKRHSAFITKNGQIWLTGNYIAEKPPAEDRKESSTAIDASELSREDLRAI